MKTICKLTLLAALLGLTVGQASANLIVNGSFENPIAGGQGWGLFTSIPGWSAVGTYPIEIGLASVYGVTGQDGNQVLEMDSTGNSLVDQIVATPGGSYTLSFLYADRAGVATSSATFDVYWNGGLVANIFPVSTVMSPYSATLVALANNTLEFRGTGTQDSYGGILDNVQLTAVPEPTTMIAGALLLLPFGASTFRFIRKNRTA
jgi:hypothetical protein